MPHESRTGTSFADALAEFKQRGSNLLVVGPPSDRARAAICRRLLGDASAGTRRRLFVETDGTASCLDDFDGPVTPETTRLVTRPTQTRSARAAESAPTGAAESTSGPAVPGDSSRSDADAGRVARRYVTDTALSTLAYAVSEEIAAFTEGDDTLDPAELRLCFDSLTPLVVDHDLDDFRRFLHAVTNRVRSCRGMAHYHLAAARDDDVVADLTPAFAAVVELRLDDDRPEQRWHVPDRDLHTDWLPL
jgi:hypothetical protein